LKDENEKTFKDLGSGFVVMKAFIDWHKKYVEWWKKKLKISNYGIFWISFIKGLIIDLSFFYQIMKKLLGILVLGLM
jgi:hypothetical protein